MKLIPITIIICLLLVYCGNPKETEVDIPSAILSNNTYGFTDIQFPSLTEAAKKQAINWGAYEDFINEVKSLNGAKYSALSGNAERLAADVDSLIKIIPDTLNTKPIVSRILVAKTRAYLLQQQINMSRFDSVAVQDHISEMNRATTNLIVQINEKFAKDFIDFQQRESEANELKKQKRFLDSVRIVELKDKKN